MLANSVPVAISANSTILMETRTGHTPEKDTVINMRNVKTLKMFAVNFIVRGHNAKVSRRDPAVGCSDLVHDF